MVQLGGSGGSIVEETAVGRGEGRKRENRGEVILNRSRAGIHCFISYFAGFRFRGILC